VDYQKIKDYTEANPNTKILMMYTMSCAVNFAGDKGKKEASKEVGEEKRKRKRLYVLREKRNRR
jgi:translation initiation factor IF-2